MTGTAELNSPLSPGLSSEHRAQLRERLVDDRESTSALIDQLAGDLDTFQGARRDSAADDEHDPEGPTLAFEHSQSSAILGQTRVHLAQIDDAIVRLDAGSFGVCVTCGKEIPAARLDARPYSTQCVVCAGKARR
jgi:DnaK suppressor protein